MGVLLHALYPNDNYSKDNHSYTSVAIKVSLNIQCPRTEILVSAPEKYRSFLSFFFF